MIADVRIADGFCNFNRLLFQAALRQQTTNFVRGFVLFMLIRQMNKLVAAPPAEPAAPPPTPEDVLLLREIRDSLKARG